MKLLYRSLIAFLLLICIAVMHVGYMPLAYAEKTDSSPEDISLVDFPGLYAMSGGDGTTRIAPIDGDQMDIQLPNGHICLILPDMLAYLPEGADGAGALALRFAIYLGGETVLSPEKIIFTAGGADYAFDISLEATEYQTGGVVEAGIITMPSPAFALWEAISNQAACSVEFILSDGYAIAYELPDKVAEEMSWIYKLFLRRAPEQDFALLDTVMSPVEITPHTPEVENDASAAVTISP